MEQTVFPDPAVAGELTEHFVEARLHNDGDHADEVRALQERFAGTYATPTYVLMDPETMEILGRHEGFVGVSRFLELLRSARG